MGSTRKIREDQRLRTARLAPVLARMDPIDRMILALELHGPGPHIDAVGVTVEEYAARIGRLLGDPDAEAYAGEVLERIRRSL